jgi:hypothetical protein
MYSIDDLTEKMIRNLKFNAIRSLKPGAQFAISSEGVVTFHDGNVLSDADIEQEMNRLSDLWYSYEYARLRANEYPDIRDYIDGIVKDDQAQVQAYIDACLAVKAKYPKP